MFTACLPWARLLAGALPLASPQAQGAFRTCKWAIKGQLFLSFLPPFDMQDSPLILKLAPLHGEGPSWPSGRVLAHTLSFTREACGRWLHTANWYCGASAPARLSVPPGTGVQGRAADCPPLSSALWPLLEGGKAALPGWRSPDGKLPSSYVRGTRRLLVVQG